MQIWSTAAGYLTIIPRARVGYEVIDSQRGAKRRVGYNHLISNKREWNNCFIKNHQQILLDFVDFAWLEQPEGNLMDAISRVWCDVDLSPVRPDCTEPFPQTRNTPKG